MNDLTERRFFIERVPDGEVILTLNGEPLERLKHHSPDGFEFGYNGSGPADLALNILHYTLVDTGFKGAKTVALWDKSKTFDAAWKYHQAFKSSMVARFIRSYNKHTITAQTVLEWLDHNAPGWWEDLQ